MAEPTMSQRSFQRPLEDFYGFGSFELSTPTGVPAISRGLSEAIPPVRRLRPRMHPEGVPAYVVGVNVPGRLWTSICCDPSRVGIEDRAIKPGVALSLPPANRSDPSGVGPTTAVPSSAVLPI